MLGAVHTTGVNLQSLAAILAPMLVIVGGFTAWLINRIEKASEKVARALGVRLDRVETHLDNQDAHVVRLGERVAAIEGPQYTRRAGR